MQQREEHGVLPFAVLQVGPPLHPLPYVAAGFCVRERALLSKSIMMESVGGMVKQARGFVEQGFKGVKVKVGIDPEQDVAAVTAIRHAVGPHIVIRLDANMGWRSAKERKTFTRNRPTPSSTISWAI